MSQRLHFSTAASGKVADIFSNVRIPVRRESHFVDGMMIYSPQQSLSAKTQPRLSRTGRSLATALQG
jgi:hypothetical protein